MKFKILLAFVMLSVFSCSTDSIDNNLTNDTAVVTNATPELTLVNASSVSITPFFEPRASIVYKNMLYTVDDASTYVFDFSTQKWDKTVNQNVLDGPNVASLPSEKSNVSFLRKNMWHILSSKALYAYNFDTRKWTIEKEFTNNEIIENPIGMFSNGNLYAFSKMDSTIYMYDFEANTFVEHSVLDLSSNEAQLVNSIYEVNGEFYYTNLSDYRTISVYKFNADFTEVELINEQVDKNLDKGSGFVYQDKIIFGLGGNIEDTNLQLNDTFNYFDTATNEFKTVENRMYESRFISLPVEYNDAHYLLGGTFVESGVKTPRKSLDKLEFDFVVQ